MCIGIIRPVFYVVQGITCTQKLYKPIAVAQW